MADLLVVCQATRPALVWWPYLLPQWVVMYTALTLRSGSCTPNLSPHLQQAEGQEEEELLQPGEGGARRQGEKEKKAALASRSRLLSARG